MHQKIANRDRGLFCLPIAQCTVLTVMTVLVLLMSATSLYVAFVETDNLLVLTMCIYMSPRIHILCIIMFLNILVIYQ